MFDSDLALLYQVPTKRLNEAVKRNIKRFPEDFMFQLTDLEARVLKSQFLMLEADNRSQIATGSQKHRDPRLLPYAFTEQGVAMLSSVLNSERAIQVNIQIMRTFTKIREMLVGNKELREKIEKLERKYDQQFQVVFKAIKKLLEVDEKPKTKIGFRLNT